MFARTLILSAAALALTAGAASAQTQTAKAPLYVEAIHVDTSECFDRAGFNDTYLDLKRQQDTNCPALQSMPAQRRIQAIRTRVSYNLCPTVKVTNPETGKVSKERACRSNLSVRDIRNLSDYELVSVARQLGVSTN